MRIALPIVSAVTVPTPQLESYILQQLPIGGRDVVTGANYPAQPQLIPFYRRLFSLYSSASGVPVPVLGCPFTSGGSPATGSPANGDGCAVRRSVSQSSADHEQVQTARVDYNAGTNDILWVRTQADTGLQAAYTDPINPLFDAVSSQPLYSFSLGYTHVFSSHLVRLLQPCVLVVQRKLVRPHRHADRHWRRSRSCWRVPAGAHRSRRSEDRTMHGFKVDAPRALFSSTTISHGLRARMTFGLAQIPAFSRLNDYDFGEGTTPTVTYTDLPQFIYGVASTATTTFPRCAFSAVQLPQRRFVCAGYLEAHGQTDLDFRRACDSQFQPLNPHMALAQLRGARSIPFHM